MSERKDDLSQWRAYGGGENGVSIGFDSEVLQRPPFRHAFLAPVCYDEQKQKAFAADLAKWTVEYFRQGFARRQKLDAAVERQRWADTFLEYWRNQVIYFAPMLKDPAFKDEYEWRLIVSMQDSDYASMKIQQRQSLIARHLPLSFGPTLPIANVVIGPSRHPGVSRISVASYLKAKGYSIWVPGTPRKHEIHVESSSVPFQTT